MKEKKRLFLDMDGTLYQFDAAIEDEEGHVQIEKMYEPDFFVNLKPYPNMIEAVKLFMKVYPFVEVFTCSAVQYENMSGIVTQKNVCLDRDLPEIDIEHRIYPEMGTKKTISIPYRNEEEDKKERKEVAWKLKETARSNEIPLDISEDGFARLYYKIAYPDNFDNFDKNVINEIPKGSYLSHEHNGLVVNVDPRDLEFACEMSEKGAFLVSNDLTSNIFLSSVHRSGWSSSHQVTENDYLIDDYNKNLNEFLIAGGVAVKCRNRVNHRGLGAYGGEKGPLWSGPIINYEDSPREIVKHLADIMGLQPPIWERFNERVKDDELEKESLDDLILDATRSVKNNSNSKVEDEKGWERL